MPSLTVDEQEWLKDYKRTLDGQFPGLVERMILFGSKARGDSRPDSDLDLIIIIKEGDWRTKKQVRYAGYDFAYEKSVIPSVIVYTRQEYQSQVKHESAFIETVNEEGITVG